MTSKVMTVINDLVQSTEDLCDALRDLRREHPADFFGRPAETLYRSLESALDSFYLSTGNDVAARDRTEREATQT
jgi:hypothetical protein